MMDNRYALLFIRGERPVMDEKYDILKHPDVALTTDGKARPYNHGAVTEAVAAVSLGSVALSDVPEMEEPETDYELLSDEELETIVLNEQEDSHNEKTQPQKGNH